MIHCPSCDRREQLFYLPFPQCFTQRPVQMHLHQWGSKLPSMHDCTQLEYEAGSMSPARLACSRVCAIVVLLGGDARRRGELGK